MPTTDTYTRKVADLVNEYCESYRDEYPIMGMRDETPGGVQGVVYVVEGETTDALMNVLLMIAMKGKRDEITVVAERITRAHLVELFDIGMACKSYLKIRAYEYRVQEYANARGLKMHAVIT